MKAKELALPQLSPRFVHVWRRNRLVWRKLAIPSILGNLADPMLYMLGLGYGLGTMLPEVGGSIDIALGECVYGDYNFEKKTYFRVEPADSAQQVRMLKEAQERHPKLAVYTLDYADIRDTAAIKDLYARERTHGFMPYVATVELDELVGEP